MTMKHKSDFHNSPLLILLSFIMAVSFFAPSLNVQAISSDIPDTDSSLIFLNTHHVVSSSDTTVFSRYSLGTFPVYELQNGKIVKTSENTTVYRQQIKNDNNGPYLVIQDSSMSSFYYEVAPLTVNSSDLDKNILDPILIQSFPVSDGLSYSSLSYSSKGSLTVNVNKIADNCYYAGYSCSFPSPVAFGYGNFSFLIADVTSTSYEYFDFMPQINKKILYVQSLHVSNVINSFAPVISKTGFSFSSFVRSNNAISAIPFGVYFYTTDTIKTGRFTFNDIVYYVFKSDENIMVDTLKNMQNDQNNNSQNIINNANQNADNIMHSYDSNSQDSDNQRFDSSQKELQEAEDSLFSSASDNFGALDMTSYYFDQITGLTAAFSFVSGLMQSIFIKSGNYGSIITIGLVVMIASAIIGLYRFSSGDG